MRIGAVGAALSLALMLSGCDLLTAPQADGERTGATTAGEGRTRDARFVHSQSEDISGYYRPVGRVGADAFALSQVFIGQARDFAAWEKGQRSPNFAPVMLEFNAPAGETVRVMPERYAISDVRISMSGRVEGLGDVSIDARLDRGALATARRNLGSAEQPAMTGVVRVGRQTVSGVKFSWYGGD